ncbi:MAG: YihY/virulence factor BrkB family protein [Candidatus Eremiobacteraeota bacterium]|nr:YihY/virulence factor BrkB family protein [Candidatus Eremiobacteraeota bacterium]
MRAADTLTLLKDAYKGWSSDQASRLAAALAFYTIFAIAPLLIIVIEIAADILGGGGQHHVVRDEILNQLRPAIGDAGTKALADLIQATFNQREKGRLAAIVGWVIFAVAATGLIAAIQNALDTVFEVQPKGGVVATITARLRAILIIAVAAILIVAMGFATNFVGAHMNGVAATVINLAIVLVFAILITAAIYKWLPNIELSWTDVWFGAIVSSVLSGVGQFLIGMYLGRAATTSAYGAAGSFVVVLLWLYYSAQLFLVGAEITKAYANRFGSRKSFASVQRGSVESPKQGALST